MLRLNSSGKLKRRSTVSPTAGGLVVAMKMRRLMLGQEKFA